jgi:hypothetical protein
VEHRLACREAVLALADRETWRWREPGLPVRPERGGSRTRPPGAARAWRQPEPGLSAAPGAWRHGTRPPGVARPAARSAGARRLASVPRMAAVDRRPRVRDGATAAGLGSGAGDEGRSLSIRGGAAEQRVRRTRTGRRDDRGGVPLAWSGGSS